MTSYAIQGFQYNTEKYGQRNLTWFLAEEPSHCGCNVLCADILHQREAIPFRFHLIMMLFSQIHIEFCQILSLGLYM